MKNLLNLLESYYEPEKITAIIQAITVDPLINKAVEDNEFLSRYWEVNQNSESVWTAANIAGFAAMFYGDKQDAELDSIEHNDLLEAGKAAMQLQNVLSSAKNTQVGIQEYLSSQTGQNQQILMNSLIYGYGFHSEKEKYLEALINVLPENEGCSVVVRTILQNSRSVDEGMNSFTELIKSRNSVITGQLLNELNSMAYATETKQLAQSWLNENNEKIEQKNSRLSIDELFALMDINRLAGSLDTASEFLSKAQKRLEKRHEQAAYLQFLTPAGNRQKQAKDIVVKDHLPTTYVVDYALSGEQITFDDIEELMPEVNENPLVAIRLAGLLQSGKPEQALQMALNAFRQLKQQNLNLNGFLPKIKSNWKAARLVRVLNDLKLPAEALQLGAAIQKSRPNDIDILKEIIKANQQLQNWDQAEAQAKTLYFNNPVDMNGLYTLAEVYEKSESWKNAYDSWKQYQALSNEFNVDTAQHFMKAAINSGFAEEALKYSDDPLLLKSNHAGISYFRGLAFEKIGDVEKAEKTFLEGTRQNAGFGKNWLALANLYINQNKSSKSVETLKTAAVHAPENVEILLTLSKLYLEGNDIETARKIMKQAVEHQTDDFVTAVQMLENLSKLDENELVYEFASKIVGHWPTNGKIAFHMASACNKLGKKNDAIRAFEIAVQSENPKSEWILDYASALVDHGEEVFELSKSIPVANYVKALQLVETIDKDNDQSQMQANLLHGELFMALGQYQKAFDHYQKLSNELDGLNPSEAIRFQIGFGTSAHHVGENEIAVAALKQATQDADKAAFVFQHMAEAYKDLNFQDEAMSAAKSAFSAAPTILTNLSWFADFAISLDATDEAKEALEVATELAPDDIEYWIAYAVILSKLEDWSSFDNVMIRIKQFPNMNQEQILSIADLYLQLGELNTALDTLQDGLLNLDQEEITLQYMLSMALLSNKTGRIIDAGQLVQKILEKRDWDAGLHTFFGDLLAGQEKYRAASASYEHACKLIEMEDQDQILFDTISEQLKKQYLEEWFASLYEIPTIKLRLSSLDIKQGKFEDAALQYEAVLNSESELSETSLLHLATGVYALENQSLLPVVEQLIQTRNTVQGIKNVKLGSLAAEMAMDIDDTVFAGQLIHQMLESGVKDVLLSSLQGRLLSLSGDWQRAEEIFEDLYSQLSDQESVIKEGSEVHSESILPIPDYVQRQIGLLKYAVGLRKWSATAKLNAMLEKNRKLAPVIGLSMINADLLTVESKRLSIELEISDHAPVEMVDSEASYSHCMSMLNDLKTQISAPAYDRLSNRIQLVYRPSLQTIRETVQLIPEPVDIRFLVPAVRRLNHCDGVNQLAQKSTNDVAVVLNLSLCYVKEHPEKAIIEIDKALSIKPNDPILFAVKSICHEKTGNDQAAYQAIEKALSIWPDEAMWHVRAANLSKKLVQSGKSKKHFATAHEIAPGNDLITNHFIGSLIDEKQYQEAFTIIDEAKHKNPSDWQWNILLADVFEKNGQLDDAEVEISEAISKSKGASLPKIKMANVLLKRPAYKKAYEIIQKVKETPENIEEIVYLRAAALHGLGESEKAIQLLESYLNKNEIQNEKLALERTRIVRELQGDRTAIAYAEELTRQFPDCAEGYALLADMHYECGDVNDAGKYLEMGLVLNSSHAKMNFLNGLLAVQNGNLDLAVHSFSNTIKEDAAHIEAYKSLSEAHLRRREFEEATRTMVQGVEANPNDVSLLLDAAKIFKDNKDYTEAESMLRKAASLKPDDVNIQRQLGAIIALNLVHNH
ncbi:MAG: tetratricopeptide repeat protein [Anaerolineaceae bacterium]|nr:tetratricopeptide repeat protein [Anaerolineaceae bacterium]